MRQLLKLEGWTVQLLKQHELVNEEQFIQYAVKTRNVPLFSAKTRRTFVTFTHPIICSHGDSIPIIFFSLAILLALFSIHERQLMAWSLFLIALAGLFPAVKNVSCSCNGLSCV
jgi:hypothetical protein